MTGTRLERPPTLVAAAGVAGLQGAALLALAVAEAASLVPARAEVAVSTALFFALYGVGLVVCAAGLLRLGSWARGPLVLAQLIHLGLAWNFRGGSWVTVAVLAGSAVVVLAGVLAPPSTRALAAAEE